MTPGVKRIDVDPERRSRISVDNLVSAEVVLADGRVVEADETQHEDLFWAIRGGGGNFGVVTASTLKLHPIATIVGGPMLWPLDRAADVGRGSTTPRTSSTSTRTSGRRREYRSRARGTMGGTMPRYMIVRTFEVEQAEMPEVGRRSRELQEAEFPDITWEHSHVVVDEGGTVRTFCIYEAPNEDVLRQHATRLGKHHIDALDEIAGDVTPADFPAAAH